MLRKQRHEKLCVNSLFSIWASSIYSHRSSSHGGWPHSSLLSVVSTMGSCPSPPTPILLSLQGLQPLQNLFIQLCSTVHCFGISTWLYLSQCWQSNLTKQQNGFKITLKTLEDNLLSRLSSASGNFLGETALVENLEVTKQTAAEVENKVHSPWNAGW